MLVDALIKSGENFEKTMKSLLILKDYFNSEPGPKKFVHVPETRTIIELGQKNLVNPSALTLTEQNTVGLSMIYNVSRAPRRLSQGRWTSKQIISNHIDALFYALEKGQLVNLYFPARAILENVSNMHAQEIEIKKLIEDREDQFSKVDSHDVFMWLNSVDDQLLTYQAQSRVDWYAIGEGGHIRKKRKASEPKTQEGAFKAEDVNILKSVAVLK